MCLSTWWLFYLTITGYAYLQLSPHTINKKKWTPPDASTFSKYSRGKHWVTEDNAQRKISYSEKGVASEEYKTRTVVDTFRKCVEKSGNKPALLFTKNGKKVSVSWKQYWGHSCAFAKSLLAVGSGKGDTVGIIGFNAAEWFYADIGAIFSGGKAAGIYTTNKPDACHYIVNDAKAKVVVVENQKHLDKFAPYVKQMPSLKAIVVYTDDFKQEKLDGCEIYSWDEFTALGEKTSDEDLEKALDNQSPEECCTLIYTSGTTGNPKGVMISHDNIYFTSQAMISGSLEEYGWKSVERGISYLPLSHVAAQMADIHMPMSLTSSHNYPFEVHFAKPDALKGSLVKTLQAVQPTIFFAVPRVWEKIQEKMIQKGKDSTGLKKMIATWAKRLGAEAFQASNVGGSNATPWGHPLAKKLVFGKVKEALGLQHCRRFWTGSAPISKSTLEFFGSLGIPVQELYGMSENTGPHSVSLPYHNVVGGCGVPLPGCETKIDHVQGRDKPGEGEILMRGRHVFMGYLHNPEKSKNALDEDGWLHSGDVGKVDKHGVLHITGRIKELIITAGGENIAPVGIEDVIKQHARGISQCVMIGDKKKYCTCLITLKSVQNQDTGDYTDQLDGEALDVSTNSKTVQEAIKDPEWKKHIQDAIDYYNEHKAVSRAQKIQYYVILKKDFSTFTGEVTPSLKLKRPVIVKKFAEEIESMYKK